MCMMHEPGRACDTPNVPETMSPANHKKYWFVLATHARRSATTDSIGIVMTVISSIWWRLQSSCPFFLLYCIPSLWVLLYQVSLDLVMVMAHLVVLAQAGMVQTSNEQAPALGPGIARKRSGRTALPLWQ